MLGAGQDDQWDKMSLNPSLSVTCIDTPAVVKLRSSSSSSSSSSRAAYRGLDIVSQISDVEELTSSQDIIVAEGLFIYLPAPIIQRILSAVERAGAVLIFNIETTALKRYNPLVVTGYEEVSRGPLRCLADLPVTSWTRQAGHGSSDPSGEV